VLPLDLIKTARKLVGTGVTRRPRQSDLKRAVSTAYYAMFHALCRNCADCLIGGTNSDRSAPAWRQAYRAVEHGFAKKQCARKGVISKFPKEIEDFAAQFKTLQEKRHSADYDPASRFNRSDVETAIDTAELAIKKFQKAQRKDRRAFAAWTAMKNRAD
jgi:uncharacterized protein (UPF0332 family)